MVELNGAYSNPFRNNKDLLWDLFRLKRKLLERKRRPIKAIEVQPRTVVPTLKAITEVLELANFEPMRVKDIHAACEQLMGRPVSYRSVKTSLSAHAHGSNYRWVRVERGWYRLGARSVES